MADPTSEYHHGQMDIHAQQAAFQGFVNLTKWGSLALAALILFLTIWFCTPAGFLAGFAAAVVLTAIGFAVLREKPGGGH